MPQNCKSPTQRQRYITTIKNVTEKEKSSKAQLDFIVPIKLTITTEGEKQEKKKKEKIQKNLENKSKHKNNKCFFLSHCCQSPFLRWESQSTSPPQDALQLCVDLWTCSGSSSDSNLFLLLCVLASNVHSYQNQCVFFCGSSQ